MTRLDRTTVVMSTYPGYAAKEALSLLAAKDGRPADDWQADQVLDLALQLRGSGVIKLTGFQLRHLRDALLSLLDDAQALERVGKQVTDHLEQQRHGVRRHGWDPEREVLKIAREISLAIIEHNEGNRS